MLVVNKMFESQTSYRVLDGEKAPTSLINQQRGAAG